MRRLAGVLVLALAASFGLAPAALGASGDTTLSIRKVDARDRAAVKVTMIYTGPARDLTGLTLREQGTIVKTDTPQSLAKAGQHVGLVLLVDLSRSMASNGALSRTKTGLRQILGDLDPADQVAIVGFNKQIHVLAGLTTDRAAVGRALDHLAAPVVGNGTAMRDGIARAATILESQPTLQPNVLLVTDGFDDGSKTSIAAARAAEVKSGAAVFALGLQHRGSLDVDKVSALAQEAGGRLFVAQQSADMPAAFDEVRSSLANQFVLTYPSSVSSGRVAIEVSVAGQRAEGSYGSRAAAAATPPASVVAPPDKPFGPAFLRSGAAELAALALAGVAAGLAVYAVAGLFGKEPDKLTSFLQPYSDDHHDDGDDNPNQALAQTAFLQRAVELTSGIAERRGTLAKIESKLEQADLPLRAAEALFFHLAGAVVLSLLALLVYGPGGFLMFGAGGVLLPPMVVKYLARRRRKQFVATLPDMLSLLSGSLRAGYSLMQGVSAVSQEVSEPMGKELRRVVTESQLGRDLEESLDGVAERMGSADFEWAVMAIRIQREVGGNLAELLMTVSETMTQRERLRRDVSTLTAEGKISAIVIGLLPVGLGGAMWAINPLYMKVLFTSGKGQVALGLAVTSALIGFAWMKKTIQIEV